MKQCFFGTPCRLVGQHCWWCMLIFRGLGYCPRYISGLDCGLKSKRLTTSVVLAGACTLVDGLKVPFVLCTGASLIYILFLLVTPFSVSNKYQCEVPALESTSLPVDHFLFCGSCSLTGCLGRSLGSFLPCISCLLHSCLAWDQTLTASLLAGILMLGEWSSAVYYAVTQWVLSLPGKKAYIQLLILPGFTYPCPVDVWVSSTGL